MMQETLNWMCEHMTFWYVDYGSHREILYPITKEKQDKVLSILDMRANTLIYGKKFYSLSTDIIMSTDRASYTYYLKESTYYKKQKALKILPYNFNDSSLKIIKELSGYYHNYKLPFIAIIIESELDMNLVSNYLNSITYLNLDDQKIITHADVEAKFDKKTFLLLANNKKQNFNQIIIDTLDKNQINYKVFNNDLSFLNNLSNEQL